LPAPTTTTSYSLLIEFRIPAFFVRWLEGYYIAATAEPLLPCA
jgi:hypothetical protein